MITKYLQKSIWHNEKIFDEITEDKDDYIRVTKDLPEKELVRKAIEILSKK